MSEHSEFLSGRDPGDEHQEITKLVINDDFEEVTQYLATKNGDIIIPYNIAKALEELAELQEILLKYVIKQGTQKQVDPEKVIEELGDVEIRLAVLKKMFSPSEVKRRVNYKITKYFHYILNKLYIGRV